jgi:hypothetical protein
MLTHNPLREVGPIVVVLAVVGFLVAPDRGVWLRTVALGFGALILLVLAVWLIGEIIARRRLARVNALAALGRSTGPERDDPMAGADAWLIAGEILRAPRDKYQEPVNGTPSLLTGADGDDGVAGACRAVVLRHLYWSKENERAVWQLRDRVEGGAETTAWLSWFLDAQVGWPEFADRVAQVGAWALPRIPAEARRPLLVRTLRHARDDQAWRVFAAAMHADLEALSDDDLPPFLRRGAAGEH